jgi:hypothetical protein
MLRKMRTLKITRQKDDPISSKGRTFSSKPSSPQLTKREKSDPEDKIEFVSEKKALKLRSI